MFVVAYLPVVSQSPNIVAIIVGTAVGVVVCVVIIAIVAVVLIYRYILIQSIVIQSYLIGVHGSLVVSMLDCQS